MTANLPESQICGLYAGLPQAFNGISSGIDSKQSQRCLQVDVDGVLGDCQADLKNHGGRDRVLHHFPAQHYAWYQQQGLMSAQRCGPAMGENIATRGVCEQTLHIGDIVAIGSTVLQVTQPRSPCFKLNWQFIAAGFSRAMQDSARCGWFYRVLTPGEIAIGDSVRLLQRQSDISLAQAMALYFAAEFTAAGYQRLLAAEGLALHWQQSLERRLSTGVIEDWHKRLDGPNPQGK